MKKMKKQKKILMITSSTIGGGPNQLLLLARELQKNFEISIATPYDDLYLKKLKMLSLSNILFIQRRKINLFDIFRLLSYLKIHQISIIHSHGKAAGVLGRLSSVITGIPLVHTFHGIHISGKNFISRFIYILYEKIFGRIDSVDVYVSESERGMAENYFLNPNNTSMIVPNGVRNYNNKVTSRKKIRSELNITEDVIAVITVCSLESVKNLFETLRVAKMCPELSFWILGEGSLLIKLQQFIKRYKISNVILHGFCVEPNEYLSAADIYFSSSSREGHPLSLLEAMSVGLPIVASEVTGNKETIIHDSSGFYYKLGDTKEAASFLKRLALDPNLRISFGVNSKSLQRKHFSSKFMAEKYQEVYSHINI